MARGHKSGCSAESYAEASLSNTRGTRIRDDSKPLPISKPEHANSHLNIQGFDWNEFTPFSGNFEYFFPCLDQIPEGRCFEAHCSG